MLIRPKRSTLKSRNEVHLERTYEFRHSKQTFTGIPIIAAKSDRFHPASPRLQRLTPPLALRL